MFDKFFVAEKLREIGALMHLRGGRSFQARAYEKGAAAIESVSESQFETLLHAGRLTELAGVGPSLAQRATELANTGSSSLLDDLRAEFPPAIVEMAEVPGLSLKKAQALHTGLGVQSLDELERACEEQRVRALKGFAAATEQKLLDSIRAYKNRPNRVLIVAALELSDRLVAHLRRCEGVDTVEIAGPVRRWCETVDDIRVVAASTDPQALIDHFVAFPLLARIEERTGWSATARLSNGLRANLTVSPPARFAAELVRSTGSPAHVEKLEARARERGLAWEQLELGSEADVYRALGLAFVPPEMREDWGEIEQAANRDAPFSLLERSDIRGMVHCHTIYSDGRDTIEAMARKAEALGLSYLTITDHSPSAHYAGGVTLDRLKEQWDEIARVQETTSVALLRGTESDILGDGSLDYPDAILEQFDVIIASIHSRMKMDGTEMTERLVRAVQNPLFKIWGHPLGRLLQRRDPFDCDVERVLDTVAASRAAIEINGDPYRLDLEPKWIRSAKSRGIKFVVSTDAHSTRAMENLVYGVAMARRGGLSKEDVLNASDVTGFREVVRPSSSRPS